MVRKGPLLVASLLLLAPAGAGCAEHESGGTAEEAREAVAALLDEGRGFLDLDREEFVVEIEQRLEEYEAILRAVEAAEPGPDDAATHELRERVAEVAELVLDIKTHLESSWLAQREALVASTRELDRDLLAAWSRVRED